ncbi:MAG: hypothetical protein OXF20_11925 [Gammaproteobacteria bacterium]|nr:hypothetical protein [Gammaproteobacteria bacterium]
MLADRIFGDSASDTGSQAWQQHAFGFQTAGAIFDQALLTASHYHHRIHKDGSSNNRLIRYPSDRADRLMSELSQQRIISLSQ